MITFTDSGDKLARFGRSILEFIASVPPISWTCYSTQVFCNGSSLLNHFANVVWKADNLMRLNSHKRFERPSGVLKKHFLVRNPILRAFETLMGPANSTWPAGVAHLIVHQARLGADDHHHAVHRLVASVLSSRSRNDSTLFGPSVTGIQPTLSFQDKAIPIPPCAQVWLRGERAFFFIFAHFWIYSCHWGLCRLFLHFYCQQAKIAR